MPLAKQWSTYKELDIPNQVGVYELGWSKNVVYIGKGDIANRIACHDRKEKVNFHQIRYEITNCRQRAGERERAELRNFKEKKGRLPKYNFRIG